MTLQAREVALRCIAEASANITPPGTWTSSDTYAPWSVLLSGFLAGAEMSGLFGVVRAGAAVIRLDATPAA